MPISPFYDREKTSIAQCQMGFINVLVKPLYVEFTSDNVVAKEGFEATWFVLCAPGYVADPALAGDCVPCAKGSFAAAAGQDACVPCAAGEYAASTGASACSPCPDYSRAIAGGAARLTSA